ncbi:MAG TPA: helix-turn-helix transcriptional regulator [Pseudomonadales bacterium]|nr:helix-turn-helix transcriptional regulator [Pseudomonadales bacterium]
MTDISSLSDPGPLASEAFKISPDFGINFGAHAPSIAKFCALRKQHFAPADRKNLLMDKKPIVQIVAESLAWHMHDKKTNAKALGIKAGVSPRTVGNFLKPTGRVSGASGKVPSGKLTELEMIAKALDITVADLVTDMSPEEREKRQRFEKAYAIMNGSNGGQPSKDPGSALKANEPLAA